MKLEEYKKLRNKYSKADLKNRTICAMLGIILGGGALYLWFVVDFIPDNIILILGMSIIFYLIIVTPIVLLQEYLNNKVLRNLNLKCPECSKPLIDGDMIEKCGICPHCEYVFIEDAPFVKREPSRAGS